MSLLNAEAFLNNVKTSHTLWLGGRFGGGKTSLAVHIAWVFLKRGWASKVITNFPCAIASWPPPIPLRDAVIVLDEAAEFAARWSDASGYVKDLRKDDLYYLMPSVFPPHNRLRRLIVTRVFNGYVVGFPAWFYSWSLNTGTGSHDKGTMIWWKPIRDIDGLYSTRDKVNSDWGIGYAMAANGDPRILDAVDRSEGRVIIDHGQDVGDDAIAEAYEDISATMSDVGAQFSQVARSLAKVMKR